MSDGKLRLLTHSKWPVELRCLKKYGPVWSADGFNAKTAAMCVRMADEPESHYLNTRVVRAELELYGGAGLGANAGGVRTANVAGVQIKGIGSTLLGGRTTDKWHKHGACSLQDAVKEAIWSNIFGAALPYGVVKALAVLDTGFTFATEVGVEKLPGNAKRALFVWEQSIRVAHQMRSSFANVGPDVAKLELRRMRECGQIGWLWRSPVYVSRRRIGLLGVGYAAVSELLKDWG
jgi:hypothetical protein